LICHYRSSVIGWKDSTRSPIVHIACNVLHSFVLVNQVIFTL